MTTTPERTTLHIAIDNLTSAQALALEDLLATWVNLGGLGSSRWTAFYADGDGNFHPRITIDGRTPKFCELVDRKKVWHGDEYRVDYDSIARKLRAEKGSS